jgi:hypothetical protein
MLMMMLVSMSPFFKIIVILSENSIDFRKIDEIYYLEHIIQNNSVTKMVFLNDSKLEITIAKFCIENHIISCKRIFDQVYNTQLSLLKPMKITYNVNQIKHKYENFATFFESSDKENQSNLSLILKSNRNFINKFNLENETVVLLISHFNESLSWLLNAHQYPFIVASKTINDGSAIYCRKNVANEASSYLEYIVKYYHNLPLYTVFLHGHDKDWHQFYSKEFILKNLDFEYDYFNINNILIFDGEYERFLLNSNNIWKTLFQYEFNIDEPPLELTNKCCAQFLVTKQNILKRPLVFYEKLLDFIYEKDDFIDEKKYHTIMSYALEYTWHIIFGMNAKEEYLEQLAIEYSNQYVRYYF